MLLLLVLMLVGSVSGSTELRSSPSVVRSVPDSNSTYQSAWTNLDDASCAIANRAAASECYARSETETLEASGFEFDIPSITELEARWDVSVNPVPYEGWILRELSMQLGSGSTLDLSSPNVTSHDESVSLRIRISGNVDWHNVVLRVSFENTDQDTIFLVSCVELRASTDWEPIPVLYEYWVMGCLVLVGLMIGIHRLCVRRHVLRIKPDREFSVIAPALYVKLKEKPSPGIFGKTYTVKGCLTKNVYQR